MIGRWITGEAACRDFSAVDELEDYWTPVLDGPKRNALLAEASDALVEGADVRR